jgi:ribosomal protein S1
MNSNAMILTGRNQYKTIDVFDTNPWPLLLGVFRRKEVLQAEISGIENMENEKAFLVWIGLIKGLIPFSQTGLENPNQMPGMLGSRVPIIITEADRSSEILYLSIVIAREILAKETQKNLQVNRVLRGIVQQVRNTHAIVDIGGVEAILNREDISNVYVGNPRRVLSVGQEVRVRITKIDQQTGKVYVSKKDLERDPWQRVTERIKLEQPYVAQVTGTNKRRGLFLKIFDGVTGMAPFPRPLPNGTRVVVHIQSIEHERKRINCEVVRVIDNN